MKFRNTCQNCKIEIPQSKSYCSSECRDSFAKYNEITFPKPFLRKIYFNLTEDERELEIITFAKRHNFDIELALQKAKVLKENFLTQSKQTSQI